MMRSVRRIQVVFEKPNYAQDYAKHLLWKDTYELLDVVKFVDCYIEENTILLLNTGIVMREIHTDWKCISGVMIMIDNKKWCSLTNN